VNRLLPVVLLLAACAAAVAADARGLEFFEAKVRPVLVGECLDCHSEKKRKGGLALDSRAGWEKGGDSGAVIVPGRPDDSLLIQTIRHEDADLKMPQKAPKLDDAIIADFVAWVQMGAPDPRDTPQGKEAGGEKSWAEKLAERKAWWCFQPIADPPLPAVKNTAWSEHPIDRFILARLEACGLAPTTDAEPAVLARRLSFALTGLPPSPKERSEQSAQTDVPHLLASPAFGEHWARHWMDLARYAETYGSEHDYLNPHAWRYRDWLIRAFNSDLPYDRFVQEQIAGDLLEPRWHRGLNESLLGVAWHRMIESYATPVDVKREESTSIDWQIENLGKTFLGLTIHCARCHDHKFDPISDEDFYALYGVFASTRPTLSILDDPATLTAHDAELLRKKDALRAALAERWRRDLAKRGAGFQSAKNTVAAKEPSGIIFADFSRGDLAGWRVSGPGLPDRPSRAGTFSLGDGKDVVRAIQPAGYYSDAISERHGGSLRSPEFIIEKKNVSVLASGSGKARLRLVVENFQNDLLLFKQVNPDLDAATPRWFTLKIKAQWLGRRARLELLTRDDKTCVGHTKDQLAWQKTDGRSAFGVQRVVFHDGATPPPPKPSQSDTRAALAAWAAGQATDDDARLLQSLLEKGVLDNKPGPDIAPLLAGMRALEAEIPVATRAPGVCEDGYSYDSPLFPRGDHLQAAAPVPRRFLEVLGAAPLGDARDSGRLALAREITRRDNPLTARVMANRIWQHLFGRGLVASSDNFGKMGEKPTHPELLDHLATKFMADGWSVKSLIRYIVTSRTWQLSSTPPPGAAKIDPSNDLLSHAHVRRLSGEQIRDAMLAVAGNLASGHTGPGVRPWYRTAIDPDKQPEPGPLDGDGVRSVYLEVRRNFPTDFLTAFDSPKPNTLTGHRSETNVPAQSLTLLNDPFVLHQARVWSEHVTGTDEDRIARMYRTAFSRPRTDAELASARAFLRSAENDPWSALAHAIFNMKEFIYLR
jgi:mono/diheme cytochrome c family protein